MALWISTYLPWHTLDSNLPQWQIKAPLAAILQEGRVIACTPDACYQGIRPGMSRNAATSMAAGLRFAQHDPQRTRRRLEVLATALLQYTPELALFHANALLLNVGASLNLFKGPRSLCRYIQTSLQRVGAQARISMAPTAAGAWLLAAQNQTARRRLLSMESLTRQLDALHVSNLPAARPYLRWLNTIGCTTLKDLRQLPRAGLNQRTSSEIVQNLDAAYGKTTLSLSWYQPAEDFHTSCLLDFHTTQAHALLHVAQSLIEQLCGWLRARQHAASALQFSLHHEKGRHACAPTCLTLQLAAPARHAEDFVVLLKEQLQHVRLHAPVIAIDLHNLHSQPACDPSGDLFPDRNQHQHQENQLLDLLRIRLGQNNILQPQPIASHLPEYANHWVELHRTDHSRYAPDTSAQRDTVVSTYPFWMLEHPVKLMTDNDHPVYNGHRLQLIRGPQRIESGWWMAGRHEQRDYFVARDSQYCQYWIYRQRDSDNPHWFLHGLFS